MRPLRGGTAVRQAIRAIGPEAPPVMAPRRPRHGIANGVVAVSMS